MTTSNMLLDTGMVAGIVATIGVAFRTAPRPRRHLAPAAPTRIGRRARRAVRRVGPGALVVAGIASAGWLPTLIAVAAVFLARRARPILARRRRRREAERQLPEAIERLVLLVHAGLTPNLAVRAAERSVPPAARDGFAAVVHRLDRGAPLGDALDALTEVLGPRASSVADAFAAADRYGLPLEPMLDRLARDARAERRRLDEADARRLPVRLTFPLVTCTLPSFVLVAIAPAVLAALSSLGATAG